MSTTAREGSSPGCGRPLLALRARRDGVVTSPAEALKLTAEQTRRITEAGTEMVDRRRALKQRYLHRERPAPHPVREGDQRVHRPEHPGRPIGLSVGDG